MKYWLRARVIEGCDEWFDLERVPNGSHHFVPINNNTLCVGAPYSQKGFDDLYEIGKALWNSDICSKFEIAAFVNGHLFWKHRPDLYNFDANPYVGRFEQMIQKEDLAFRSEDFQNDPVELKYLQDYQHRFWSARTVCDVGAFEQTIQDTLLYEGMKNAKTFLDNGHDVPESVGFEHKGTWINNPFFDETLRFVVEPLSYYGVENVRQYIASLSGAEERLPNKNSLDAILQDATPRSKATESMARTEPERSLE